MMCIYNHNIILTKNIIFEILVNLYYVTQFLKTKKCIEEKAKKYELFVVFIIFFLYRCTMYTVHMDHKKYVL